MDLELKRAGWQANCTLELSRSSRRFLEVLGMWSGFGRVGDGEEGKGGGTTGCSLFLLGWVCTLVFYGKARKSPIKLMTGLVQQHIRDYRIRILNLPQKYRMIRTKVDMLSILYACGKKKVAIASKPRAGIR
jgi:hypothetical protein